MYWKKFGNVFLCFDNLCIIWVIFVNVSYVWLGFVIFCDVLVIFDLVLLGYDTVCVCFGVIYVNVLINLCMFGNVLEKIW